jgi:hypothetical protein
MLSKKYKIIIWGHRTNGHTHSFIHSSYYKAFSKLGYETYWFEDSDNTSGFDFNDCIFLTEGQVQYNIPLNKTCKYILHHTNSDKYDANGLTYINLGNYLKYCDDGISANHKENTVEKIDTIAFWDDKTRTLYQPWATDLMPDEINIENAIGYNENKKTVTFVGTSQSHDNTNDLKKFIDSVINAGYSFRFSGRVSDEENVMIVRQSLVSFDLRGDWHRECGYLPCRIFKNISYGRLTGTNSENVKKVLGEHVIYEPNVSLLFEKLLEAEKTTPIENIKSAMQFVKEHHTYYNRIENILKVI